MSIVLLPRGAGAMVRWRVRNTNQHQAHGAVQQLMIMFGSVSLLMFPPSDHGNVGTSAETWSHYHWVRRICEVMYCSSFSFSIHRLFCWFWLNFKDPVKKLKLSLNHKCQMSKWGCIKSCDGACMLYVYCVCSLTADQMCPLLFVAGKNFCMGSHKSILNVIYSCRQKIE